MRILHTSDWHIGRSMGEFSLLDQQAEFFDWLIGAVATERIDLVVVAGDIFDRTNPSVEATELWSSTLRRITAIGVCVAAISGNHDEAIRIDAFSEITDKSGVFMRGGFRSAGQVTRVDLTAGSIDLVLLPYMAPTRVSTSLTESIEASEIGNRVTHQSVLKHFADIARLSLSGARPSLAVAHAFVRGGLPSESERELSIGGVDLVDAAIFDGFDYVALGHLHRPQIVGGRELLRYSGSPLPYSFSETHAKSVAVVEFENGVTSVEAIEIHPGRRVTTIEAPFEAVMTSPEYSGAVDSWTRVVLTDAIPMLDSHRRIRERFPFLVELSRSPVVQSESSTSRLTSERARGTQAVDVLEMFWADVTQTPYDDTVRNLVATSLLQLHEDGDDQ